MKHLLVIADQPGGKNTALIRAYKLQQLVGCKITLLGFSYVNIQTLAGTELGKLSHKQLEKKVLLKRKQELSWLLDTLKLSATRININVQWSKDIAPAINAYCAKYPVDMVIKTAHHSETLLYTSTDWQLIRECPAPVMITARKSWKKKSCILAAVDFATKTPAKIALNHRIMEQALALANIFEQPAHLVFALSIPQPLVDMDLINPAKHAKAKRQKLQASIDAFCQQYDLSKEQIHIKTGAPEKVIPSIANKLKSDLVITGTVGRKGIKGKLIGNTAEAVLSNLHTDIIALKP